MCPNPSRQAAYLPLVWHTGLTMLSFSSLLLAWFSEDIRGLLFAGFGPNIDPMHTCGV